MKVLIAYSTTEGQTRKIARFVSDRLIGKGHSVELWPAAEGTDVDVGTFDRAILAGSVHLESLQRELEVFASSQKDALGKIKTLLLTVSLSAAGMIPRTGLGWTGL